MNLNEYFDTLESDYVPEDLGCSPIVSQTLSDLTREKGIIIPARRKTDPQNPYQRVLMEALSDAG